MLQFFDKTETKSCSISHGYDYQIFKTSKTEMKIIVPNNKTNWISFFEKNEVTLMSVKYDEPNLCVRDYFISQNTEHDPDFFVLTIMLIAADSEAV